MSQFERQIIAWLCILVGAWFLARATVNKRQRSAMKELLGVPIDKVKFFRNYFIQRLESMIGFAFVLVGVGIHLSALIRRWQIAAGESNAPEVVWDAATYLGFAVVAMVAITVAMQWICSYFSRRIFLDILGYLMIRYDYRVEEDPDLLVQIGDMVGVERSDEDTVETYTRRIEAALKLPEIQDKLRAQGKKPMRRLDLE